jgi:hypothetical protein
VAASAFPPLHCRLVRGTFYFFEHARLHMYIAQLVAALICFLIGCIFKLLSKWIDTSRIKIMSSDGWIEITDIHLLPGLHNIKLDFHVKRVKILFPWILFQRGNVNVEIDGIDVKVIIQIYCSEFLCSLFFLFIGF